MSNHSNKNPIQIVCETSALVKDKLILGHALLILWLRRYNTCSLLLNRIKAHIYDIYDLILRTSFVGLKEWSKFQWLLMWLPESFVCKLVSVFSFSAFPNTMTDHHHSVLLNSISIRPNTFDDRTWHHCMLTRIIKQKNLGYHWNISSIKFILNQRWGFLHCLHLT